MKGIWSYSELNSEVSEEYRLTLNEGDTTLEEFEDSTFLKREDLNPTGSQKDRSLCYQISSLTQKNIYKFCISSSGNSAISAAAYFNIIKSSQKSLDIFISPNIPEYKQARLIKWINNSPYIKIHVTHTPKKDCIQFANNEKAYNLRGSTDPLAIEGFKSIGFELQEQKPEAECIFIPTSSATTLMGIYKSYTGNLPAIHAVQTAKVHPIAGEIDKSFFLEKTSHASAITDIIAYRKKECIMAIKQSNGSAWVIQDNELLFAYRLLASKNKKVSYDSALSLAGFLKAKKSGYNYKNAILLITGK